MKHRLPCTKTGVARLLAIASLAAVSACSGPSTVAPTGFPGDCPIRPRLGGKAEMGVIDGGFATDVDTKISISNRPGGPC